MNKKVDDIIEQLSTLNLIDTALVVKKMEEIFGISTASPMMTVSAIPQSSAPVDAVEEKTEFKLSLDQVPADKKIGILKIVRTITGLGLKEAKDLVEAAPKIIQESITKEAGELAKKQLEEAGAKVTLK